MPDDLERLRQHYEREIARVKASHADEIARLTAKPPQLDDQSPRIFALLFKAGNAQTASQIASQLGITEGECLRDLVKPIQQGFITEINGFPDLNGVCTNSFKLSELGIQVGRAAASSKG